MKLDRKYLPIIFSVIAGVGLGFALTYALNALATNQLTTTGLWASNVISDYGAVFNNASSNHVIIDGSNNVTIPGTVSATNANISGNLTVNGQNVCRQNGFNCPMSAQTIDSGKYTMSLTSIGNGQYSQTAYIYFNKSFSSVPVCVVSLKHLAATIDYYISLITNTDCTVFIYGNSSGPVELNWVAIGT